MSLRVLAYQDRKESHLGWLGHRPAHWQVLRAKHLFDCVDVRSTTGDEELLTVSSNDGVVPRSSKTITMFMAESYVGHKLCWPGDLVINSLWAWARGLGFSRHHGIVSSAYGVYRPKRGYREHADYWNYLLRSTAYDWELHVRSKGIWISRLQMTDEAFLDMPIVVPPAPEARQVVRFLRHMDRRINRLIRAKRRMIELLNEQKQAIINRAVTRGLDPNVRLKPSGIDWLGDVPEHWELRRNRTLLHLRKRTVGNKSSDFKLLSLTLRGVIARDMDNPGGKWPADFATYQVVEPHDLVFCLFDIDETPRTVGISGELGMITGAYTVCRAVSEDVARFLYLFYLSVDSQKRLRPFYTGLRKVVQKSTFMGLTIPLPPAEERSRITLFVDEETRHIDATIDRCQREIDLIREYRTRLIADVVTGKLDVRGVELPPIEDEEPLDEGELVEETEEPFEEEPGDAD